jgi:murein DD-endopeptidase MepM/ murein hydrolase activator NlpD
MIGPWLIGCIANNPEPHRLHPDPPPADTPTLDTAASTDTSTEPAGTPKDSGEPPSSGGPFRFPADPAAFTTRVGIDHDPVVQDGTLIGSTTCTDYAGRTFPHCYDEHHGTDYLLRGGFTAMDEGSTDVLAAAAGVVVLVVDENYDRCHSDLGEITCDGYPIVKNEITIEHGNGLRTRYYHLMQDSAVVEVGDQVACGDPLAKVGSSGNSSGPHLHFQIEDASGDWIDPYAGPYSQTRSLWVDQGDDDEGFPGTDCR